MNYCRVLGGGCEVAEAGSCDGRRLSLRITLDDHYLYVYIHMYYLYIYIEREREKYTYIYIYDREGGREREREIIIILTKPLRLLLF